MKVDFRRSQPTIWFASIICSSNMFILSAFAYKRRHVAYACPPVGQVCTLKPDVIPIRTFELCT